MRNDKEKMDFDDTETEKDLLLDLTPEGIERLYEEIFEKPAQE